MNVYVRVIRHVDGGLVCATDQLRLVLHAQHRHVLPVDLLGARRVGYGGEDLAGVAHVAVLAPQLELDALATLVELDARDLP